jgi:hypothetical protein
MVGLMFGWVSRAEFEEMRAMHVAAENLRIDAVVRLGQSETARMKDLDAAGKLYEQATDHARRLEAELAEEKRENKLLLDRIVQMSGQPALFEKTAPVTPQAPTQPASTLPGPAARVSFDDVHSAARTALKDGTFSISKGRTN